MRFTGGENESGSTSCNRTVAKTAFTSPADIIHRTYCKSLVWSMQRLLTSIAKTSSDIPGILVPPKVLAGVHLPQAL